VWSIDLEAFRGSFGERTKAALVVSPNNPTGSLLRAPQWPELRDACERRGVAIVCDEVFGDYLIDPADDGLRSVMTDRPAGDGPLTIVLSGLSKLIGLPQHKLAWMILDGAPALVEEARRRLELISDTYLSVGTAVQRAAPRLFRDGTTVREAIAERARANWRVLRAQMARWPACSLLRVEGGWSAVLRVPSVRSEESLVVELVEQDGVLVHPGFFFDFDREAFLVISLLPEPATFAEGMARVFRRAG
jgi:aspartate/methionine/tyrosine aminotransferase